MSSPGPRVVDVSKCKGAKRMSVLLMLLISKETRKKEEGDE
jgi:hypothetical protein